MTMTVNDGVRLTELESRIRAILPEEYQNSFERVEPVPMRSAGLKYRADGRVAWDEIWGSFCDLAMAGGPPHKGTLLEPGRSAEIEAQPERYEEVAEEICRGVRMAADLDAEPSPVPGWVRVICSNAAMSGWLLRAIVMENVAVRSAGARLDVPAAPHFRLDKEIKNVVTVVAKTSHYWLGHMPRTQQRAIAELFIEMAEESALIEPGGHRERNRVTNRSSGLAASLPWLARVRMCERTLRHLDDARDGSEQCPLPARRDGAVRSGQPGDRSRRAARGRRTGDGASARGRKGDPLTAGP